MLKESARKKNGRVVWAFGIILLAALSMFGCATTETIQPGTDQAGAPSRQEASSEVKLITGISIEETAEAIVVVIEANHVIDYTLAEPPLQQAKVLYFPDSALSLSTAEYPVDNEIIGTIQAVELVKGGPSKIVIPIKIPAVACEAQRGDDDQILKVVFPRIASGQSESSPIFTEEVGAEEGASPEETATEVAEAETDTDEVAMSDQPPADATRVESIEVIDEAGGVTVKVKGDGTIKNFKSFTLKGPPRIVLDLAGLTSPYKKEQRQTVDSDTVQKVRYCGHPGYLRLVMDVAPNFLSDYKAVPVYDGLKVYVGNTEKITTEGSMTVAAPQPRAQEESAAIESSEETGEEVATQSLEEEAVDTEIAEVEAEEPVLEAAANDDVEAQEETVAARGYDGAALVNQIDFIDEQGRSTIRIGTTHPVAFDLSKTGDKKLRLRLEGADILSYRQRPLITTRFDSAVNAVIPLQTEAMKAKGFSVVDISLREEVGYNAEQSENSILVRFEPSSMPADPAAQEVVMPAEVTPVQEMPAKVKADEAGEMTAAMPAEETGAIAGIGLSAGEMAADLGEAAAPSEDLAQPEVLAGKKAVYTGEPIALEFYKTDIRNVIQILKDVSGKNFAIDENVSGSATLSFVNPVPWDQVLDLVLEMNNLGMVEKNGVVRISTKDTLLKQREAERAAMAAEQELKATEEQLAPLVTEYFAISYSDADADVLPHVEPILTKDRGHAKVDSRTNQLIMTDIQEKIDMAREIIEKIDRVTPQVMINARIVETSTNFSREFGTEWGFDNSPGTYRHEVGGTYNYNVALNNPANSATNTLGINFSRIVGTPFSLDAKLSLMETVGEVRIISSPRVVTLDNKQATISQGQEIPYTTVDDGEADTEFKDADLKLEVTPHVTPDNRISMKIHIEEKEVGEQGSFDEPPLNTKEANTELLVNDGDTIVIGGIIQETEKESMSGIPLIDKIPFLGHLFKTQARSSEKSELLIFITPTIVRLD